MRKELENTKIDGELQAQVKNLAAFFISHCSDLSARLDSIEELDSVAVKREKTKDTMDVSEEYLVKNILENGEIHSA